MSYKTIFTTFGVGPRPVTPSRSNTYELMTRSGMALGRPAAYGINGTGRDSYIATDNGGFTVAFAPAYNPDTGVFGARMNRMRDPTMATIDAKHANYNSNGSGRDGYIR